MDPLGHFRNNFQVQLLEINCRYRVIRKTLRDFRPLRYRSRDGPVEGEHVNRGTDTPSFCSTLQVLDVHPAVSVLVVAQPSSDVPEGLTNYTVYVCACVCACCEELQQRFQNYCSREVNNVSPS